MNSENGRKQKPATSLNSNNTYDQQIKRRRKEVLEDENLDLRTRELLRDTFESLSIIDTVGIGEGIREKGEVIE